MEHRQQPLGGQATVDRKIPYIQTIPSGRSGGSVREDVVLPTSSMTSSTGKVAASVKNSNVNNVLPTPLGCSRPESR